MLGSPNLTSRKECAALSHGETPDRHIRHDEVRHEPRLRGFQLPQEHLVVTADTKCLVETPVTIEQRPVMEHCLMRERVVPVEGLASFFPRPSCRSDDLPVLRNKVD